MSHLELRRKLLAQTHLPVSPILMADYSLYRSVFARDERDAAYANTFTYITQACRAFGRGIKCVTPGALYSIGAHRDHYVVVRPVGVLDQQFFDLVHQLHTLSGKPVFVKKLFPDQVEVLKRRGGFALTMTLEDGSPVPGPYVWDESAYADDDTYPELIYDAEVLRGCDLRIDHWGELYSARRPDLASSELRSFKGKMLNFRRALHRTENRWSKPQISRCTSGHASDVFRFLEDYFQGREAHLRAHLNALTSPPEACEPDYFNLVTELVGWDFPAAYHVGERVGSDAASFCIGVASKAVKGFASVIYFYLFEYLEPHSIRRINVGGAETLSLHEFKRNAAPVEERYMAMMVYGGHTQ